MVTYCLLLVVIIITKRERSPSGPLVQFHSEHLAQSLMDVPAYLIVVDVAIVLLGPRRWRRSNIVTINLR